MCIKAILSWSHRRALCWVPIRVDEQLLRVITKDWYLPERPVPFGSVAFKPNKNDVDGISLYSERFVTPVQLDKSRRKPGTYFVVRLRVKEILALHLSVRANMGDLPGHVVIPELNVRTLAENKTRTNELMVELTKLAGYNVALRPSV